MHVFLLRAIFVLCAAVALANATVVINEVSYVSAPPTCDGNHYVELYNVGSSSVNLTGWVLLLHNTLGANSSAAYTFPNSSSIASLQYVVLCRGESFRFNISQADTISLLNATTNGTNGSGNGTVVSTTGPFPSLVGNTIYSIQRTSLGTYVFGEPTPGWVNFGFSTRRPTKAPIPTAGTPAPVVVSTKSPTLSKSPIVTKGPTKAPTKAPIRAPTRAPIKPPTKWPTMTPIRRFTTFAPTGAPITRSTPAPQPLSTAAPVQPPTSTTRRLRTAICHFPKRNRAKFRTKRVWNFLVRYHLKRGDLLGPCTDHCEAICLGNGRLDNNNSTASSAPPLAQSSLSACAKRCLPNGQRVAFVSTQNTPDFRVVSCTNNTVEVEGPRAKDFAPGFLLIHVEDESDLCSSFCSPLYRKVEAVLPGLGGDESKMLITSYATFGEVLSETDAPPANVAVPSDDAMPSDDSPLEEPINIKDDPIEPFVACGSVAGALDGRQLYAPAPAPPPQTSGLSIPKRCTGWQAINTDGRCKYTNCYVGRNGDPNNCYSCTKKCNNGCGAAGSFLNTKANFGLFSFTEACCIHDYCYSTNSFSRSACDKRFYDDMYSQCLSTPAAIFSALILPSPFGGLAASCNILATSFYGAVAAAGKKAYNKVQASERVHEKKDVCTAKCPTLQESGGQGTSRLTVDMRQTSGTFLVTYNMFTVPDRLTITYEGVPIFDTGGPVSYGRSQLVSFAGKSRLLEVIVYAPQSGTLWDVQVDCPRVR